MVLRKAKIYVGDFETTVYKGQKHTEVWASACVEMYTEDVHIFHSIDEQFNYFLEQKSNVIVYYHNLKFDGNFWMSYLMTVLELKQACEEHDANNSDSFRFLEQKDMPNNTFIYSIADTGQWYRIIIKKGGYFIEIRDSLKLLPFGVKKIGKGFKTKHQKLDMEYEGFRYSGCDITDEEKEYIANDVLVVKEALETMFNEGHKKLTIGSCCLSEYKKTMKGRYKQLFPNLYEVPLDESYGAKTVGDYIHKSYHGGWCYLAKGKENKQYTNGITADVNSLYPSMMSSESGNRFPIGYPTFWKGDIPAIAWEFDKYFFRAYTNKILYKGWNATIHTSKKYVLI